MQDRPSARELLEAVAEFLQREVMSRLDGRLRFHARVAANVLEIVGRELECEGEHLRAEWGRLDALLGPEPLPEDIEVLRGRLRERTELLCHRLRGGGVDAADLGRVRAHVRETVREKLLVVNPAFLEAGGPDAGRARRSGERGVALVAVLIALLVVAALYFGLPALRPSSGSHGTDGGTGVAALERAREAACRTSRQMIERSLVMWRARHPGAQPSIGDLAREGIRVSPCPEGGEYVVAGGRVYCTVHDPPP